MAKYSFEFKKQIVEEYLNRQGGVDFFEFKLHVVELYLSTEFLYQELALAEGINNPQLITKWVNDFRIAGPDELRPKKKGRKKLLKASKKAIQPNQVNITSVDTSTEHVK